ncbi:hypothetical protein WJX73_006330 [Symbiochloris irregularis]|uniref:Uncharacterized protein n=1 Tax=Symbiochloris irregularis TaxID=706552 RepID=A0AAW1P4Q5_9CHLO
MFQHAVEQNKNKLAHLRNERERALHAANDAAAQVASSLVDTVDTDVARLYKKQQDIGKECSSRTGNLRQPASAPGAQWRWADSDQVQVLARQLAPALHLFQNACILEKCLTEAARLRLPPSLPLGTLFSFSMPAALQLPGGSPDSCSAESNTAQVNASMTLLKLASETSQVDASESVDAGHDADWAVVESVRASCAQWSQPGFDEIWRVPGAQSCYVHQHVVL